MTPRAAVRPAIDRLVVLLRARSYPVDVALQRLLRDFGLDCYSIGVESVSVHTAVTLPAPHTTTAVTVPAPADETDQEIEWTLED